MFKSCSLDFDCCSPFESYLRKLLVECIFAFNWTFSANLCCYFRVVPYRSGHDVFKPIRSTPVFDIYTHLCRCHGTTKEEKATDHSCIRYNDFCW